IGYLIFTLRISSYSANLEFMNINNSFLVKYSVVKITEDHGPYKKGNFWAEPDIDHAAYLMQYVFNNYEDAKQIAKKASEHIKSVLSPKVIGEKIKNRLAHVMQRRHYSSNIDNLYTKLQYQTVEIQRLQNLVKTMETSKFWQLRNQWLKLKKIYSLRSTN
ncbi:glycosyl transferase family 2, partial [Fischerella thermalis WC344]